MGTLLFIFIIFIIIWSVKSSGVKKSQDEIKHDLYNIRFSVNQMNDKISAIQKKVGAETIPEVESQEVKEIPPIIQEQIPEPDMVSQVQEAINQDHKPEPVHIQSEEAIKEESFSPREKSKLEQTVGQILKKIWSWILVGEEYRPKNVSMEYAVASTWLMRVGIMALVICVGYFLKWTMDKEMLGPNGRVMLSVIAGITMLGVGMKNLEKKYHILAQGFLGGGLATLYFSMYAAGPMYHIIGMPFAFTLMVFVTIVAAVLALKANSQLIAIFSIIGGFCTPMILRISGPGLGVLYAYMLLLSVGILGMAHIKNWRLLNYLGFGFTWMLFFQSLSRYVPSRDFAVTMSFLTLLFILHSVIVYYYNLVKSQKSTSLEIVHLLFNSLLYAMTSYSLIIRSYGKPWPAVMAVGLAIFYILHVFVFLKKQTNDRKLLIALIGIAGFFTAWAVPLITAKETLTICWSLLAFFFLWIGLKLNSNLLVTFSSILYFLVMGRLVFLDMPRDYTGRNFSNIPMFAYWRIFFDRIFTFGIVIASFFGAFFLHRRKINQLENFSINEKNNTHLFIAKSAFREIMFWSGVLFLFFLLYFEFGQMFMYYLPFQMPMLTILWCGLGLFVLYHFKHQDRGIFLGAAIFILMIIFGKLLFFDLNSWGFIVSRGIYRSGNLYMLMRLLDYGVVFLFLMMIMKCTQERKSPINYNKVFLVTSTALIFVYLTLEVNTFFHWYLPAFQNGSISILWALFAISYLLIGIKKLSVGWRYSGLMLFVIVVIKVFFGDLSGMEMFYRVIAFMILGIVLIGGSFAYIKSNTKFVIEEDKK